MSGSLWEKRLQRGVKYKKPSAILPLKKDNNQNWKIPGAKSQGRVGAALCCCLYPPDISVQLQKFVCSALHQPKPTLHRLRCPMLSLQGWFQWKENQGRFHCSDDGTEFARGVCSFKLSGTERQSLQNSWGGVLVNLQLSLLGNDNKVQILFHEVGIALV